MLGRMFGRPKEEPTTLSTLDKLNEVGSVSTSAALSYNSELLAMSLMAWLALRGKFKVYFYSVRSRHLVTAVHGKNESVLTLFDRQTGSLGWFRSSWTDPAF